MAKYGMDAGIDPEKATVPTSGRFVPGTGPSTEKRDLPMEAVQRFVRAFTYEDVPWREAQEAGMLWAPLRKPHENAMDPHWLARRSCADVEHPELGRSFRYATSKWLATGTTRSFRRGVRSPVYPLVAITTWRARTISEWCLRPCYPCTTTRTMRRNLLRCGRAIEFWR